MKRAFLMTAALGLFTAACQTVPEPLPPIQIAPGKGVAALNLCVEPTVTDYSFSISLAPVTADGQRIVEAPASVKQTTTISFESEFRRQAKQKFERVCRLWDLELDPGRYTVADFSGQYAVSGTDVAVDPLFLLIIKMGAAAVSEAKKKVITFTGSDGILAAEAPVFEVNEAEVAYLGEMIFRANTRVRDIPVREANGYWDGQSTDRITELQVVADYSEPGAEIRNHAERLSLGTYSSEPFALAGMTGKTFLLEDFPEIKPGDPQ
ncbi:MAG: hypothetical protein JJ959_10430 [Nisaea sp.]|uniref:hypothetical protein n=1 Tax=Nisaea sp. TaxID=2024842 RepID=UPI001B2D4598|nr:hypothetical protein [Nisaea sp.]MBO6560946.1 hypothetical protein [Nisaea sp.]